MSEQERAVIDAAKTLVARLDIETHWRGGKDGQERCPCCTNYGYHSPNCELVTLVNTVDVMNTTKPSRVPNEHPKPYESDRWG